VTSAALHEVCENAENDSEIAEIPRLAITDQWRTRTMLQAKAFKVRIFCPWSMEGGAEKFVTGEEDFALPSYSHWIFIIGWSSLLITGISIW
jgi:hypothetical protein